jgi:hypothetical protein
MHCTGSVVPHTEAADYAGIAGFGYMNPADAVVRTAVPAYMCFVEAAVVVDYMLFAAGLNTEAGIAADCVCSAALNTLGVQYLPVAEPPVPDL